MSYKWVRLEGSDGRADFKISSGGDKHYVSNASGDSVGSASSFEDAISVAKSKYGGKVWSVDVGAEQTGCFPASTLILMPYGLRNISTIEAGEHVISFDRGRATPRVSTVTRRLDHAKAVIWEIGTSRRSTPIRCTEIHAYLTNRGWVQARNLRIGDELIGISGQGKIPFQVTRVSAGTSLELVYNLHTSGDHTFVADGFVVHNFSHFRMLRTLWHQLLVDPFVKNDLRGRETVLDSI